MLEVAARRTTCAADTAHAANNKQVIPHVVPIRTYMHLGAAQGLVVATAAREHPYPPRQTAGRWHRSSPAARIGACLELGCLTAGRVIVPTLRLARTGHFALQCMNTGLNMLQAGQQWSVCKHVRTLTCAFALPDQSLHASRHCPPPLAMTAMPKVPLLLRLNANSW